MITFEIDVLSWNVYLYFSPINDQHMTVFGSKVNFGETLARQHKYLFPQKKLTTFLVFIKITSSLKYVYTYLHKFISFFQRGFINDIVFLLRAQLN